MTNQTNIPVTKATFMFDGIMTAVSHLATCGPSLKSKASKGDPTPIPILSNADGKFMYMPGAGLRSKLRGAATMLILQAARKRNNMPIQLGDAQYLRLGGVKQNGAELAFNSLEHDLLVNSNPLISLFGSSTPWVTGKLMVSHQTCIRPSSEVQPMHVDGVRSSMFKRNPQIFEFLDPTAAADYASQVKGVKESVAQKKQIKELERLLRAVPRNDQDAASAYRSQIAELKGENKIVVSEQMPLEGYLAIPPGAELSTSMRLLNANEVELGCLISSLEQFALLPVLGAHLAHGAGEVRVTWTVREAGSSAEIGEVKVIPFVGLKIDGERLVKAKSAFLEFLANSPAFNAKAPLLTPPKKEKPGADGE